MAISMPTSAPVHKSRTGHKRQKNETVTLKTKAVPVKVTKPACCWGGLAAMSHVVFDGGTAVGASGAINGVIGMYLAFYPLNTVSCLYWIWVRVGRFSVSGYWLILFWLAFDILGIAMRSVGVAYWAHAGGFVAGFALAVGLLVTGLVRMTNAERSRLDIFRRGRREASGGVDSLPSHSAPRMDTAPADSTDGGLGAGRMVEPLRVECSCGQVLKIPGRFVGRMVKCPVCGQAIRAREE